MIVVTVLNGLSVGLLLFIVAVGLSLVFGMMDVLNLAHGALFLTGAYTAWFVAGEDPTLPGFLAALAVAGLAGMVAGGGLSLMTEPLSRRSHLDQALLTLGVALVVSELLALAFTRDVRAVNPPRGLDRPLDVFDSQYPVYRLVLIGIGLLLTAVLYYVVERTSIGALIRATVDDRDMVAASGIDVRVVRVAVFAAGSALAMMAGVLGSPIYSARPGLDITILILALVVVVVGGLGSVRGVLLGALLIGQVESLGRALLSDLASFLLFGTLAVVLALRPYGLFRVAGGR